MTNKKFSISSYNCRNFNDLKIPYCKNILKSADILLLQEHCLFESMFSEFLHLGYVDYHAVSPMDINEPIIGRPYGGCAIIWHSNIDCKIRPVSIDSGRVCAVTMTFENGTSLLLINTYLPCDDRYAGCKYDDTLETLSKITSLIEEHDCDLVIVAGDLNAHFDRNTPHVKAVLEFANGIGLKCGSSHVLSNVRHTFESKSCDSTSLIDHFLTSEFLFRCITSYHTQDDIINLSDHVALLCEFDVDLSYHEKCDKQTQQHAAWRKAKTSDIDAYKQHLEQLLSNQQMPMAALRCMDHNCNDHNADLDAILSIIVNACLEAESKHIPQTGPANFK